MKIKVGVDVGPWSTPDSLYLWLLNSAPPRVPNTKRYLIEIEVPDYEPENDGKVVGSAMEEAEGRA